MSEPMSTCWTAIREAARGSAAERERFAQRYRPAVLAYVRGCGWLAPGDGQLEDAVQEVFLECFKPGGVLEKARRGAGSGSFRAFLRGVTKNVVARAGRSRGRRPEDLPDPAGGPEVRDDPGEAFDRAWARMVMQEAAASQALRARILGADAVRRVELLRLRFEEDLPIRDIARAWDADPAAVHKDYARARREFQDALREVVAFHAPGSAEDVDKECKELLALLA